MTMPDLRPYWQNWGSANNKKIFFEGQFQNWKSVFSGIYEQGNKKMKRLLIFFGIAILIFSFGCKGSDKEGNFPPNEGFVEVEDDIEIFFRTIGDGPELVIVPAGMYMDIEFKKLANEDRTLVFYDMRGRGRSSTVDDPEWLGMNFDILDLETLRQYLGGVRVSLIGWSYLGAMVALYALKYPDKVKRVVQVGPLPPTQEIFAKATSTPMDSESQALVKKMKDEGLDKSNPERFCYEYWNIYMKRIFYDPEKLSRFQSYKCKCKNELPENVNFHLSSIIKSLGDWDWREDLKNLEVPVLTIQGEQDPSCPLEGARTWAAWLRNARLLVIPEAGHMPFVEQPDAFYPSVEAFLKGEWPERTEVLGVPVYTK